MQFSKGPGVWKLNTKVLTEAEYLQLINNTITRTAQWAEHLDPQDRWDMVKMVIIQESQSYCRQRAWRNKSVIENLRTAILNMEENMGEPPAQTDIDLLEKSKTDLQQLIEEKTKGSIFRAKVRWYNEGEKKIPSIS